VRLHGLLGGDGSNLSRETEKSFRFRDLRGRVEAALSKRLRVEQESVDFSSTGEWKTATVE